MSIRTNNPSSPKKQLGEKSYYNHLDLALQIIGGNWKPLIIWELRNSKAIRFNQLKKQVVGITQKMLSAQLKELEKYNIVQRKSYSQVPPKVEYSLTDFGKAILPVFIQISEWGGLFERNNQESEDLS